MNINDSLRNSGIRSNPSDMPMRPNVSQTKQTKYEDQAMRDIPDFNAKKHNTEISPRDVPYTGNMKSYLPNTLQIKHDDQPTKIFKGVLVTLGSPIILPCLASHAVVVAVGNAQSTSIAKDANQLTDRKNVLISQINTYKAARATHEKEIYTYTHIISDRRAKFQQMLADHIKQGKVFHHNLNRESMVLTNYYLKTEIYFDKSLTEEKSHLSNVNANIKILEKELNKVNEKITALNLKNVKITQ